MFDTQSNINQKELIDFIVKNKISTYEIGQNTGVSNVAVGKIINGKTKKANQRTLKDIASYINEKFDNSNFLVNEAAGDYKTTIIKKPPRKKLEGVPFYDIDFIGGDMETIDAGVKPAYLMDIPEFSGCKAFRIYGDSMESIIKSGTIVFSTKVEQWDQFLEYGQIYGIVCMDGRRFCKYIRKDDDNPSDYFLLKSANRNYDEFSLPKTEVRSIWLIHGWLNKRA